ncbi:MAG: hypothetical protein H6745_20110 [Deltaproteobacteria bacterium]|nr:hypothetical protein [Deltaproteobacteria bacterium]
MAKGTLRAPLSGWTAALALTLAASALVRCADGGQPAAPDGTALRVDVAALSLPGVTDATWDVAARADGALLWEKTLTSSAYGDGRGDVSYVGTCDAAATTNTVSVTLTGLSADGAPLEAGSWLAPPTATKAAPCSPNGDSAVAFDITVARKASQGFFDVAVSFDDLFCSAKLDCGATTAPEDDLLLLHDPTAGGARGTTAVLALACTPGPDGAPDTRLYLDDVTITCAANGGTDTVVDVSQRGNVALDAASNPLGYLFAASVYSGEEALANKRYWNVALGLDRDAFEAAGKCTLRARATASDGPLSEADPLAIADGVLWPVVTWEVDLSDAGGRLCTQHPLDGDPPGVDTRYEEGPKDWDHGEDGGGDPIGPTDPGDGGGDPTPSGNTLLTWTEEALAFPASAGSALGYLALVDATTGDVVPADDASGAATLTSDAPSCVSVAASRALTSGASYHGVALTYGGAALPCTATVHAAAAGLGADDLLVTVEGAPTAGTIAITDTRGEARVGQGLEVLLYVSLSTSPPPGGVPVTLTSSDPSVAFVSRYSSQVGGASATFTASSGGSYGFTVQSTGSPGTTVTVTASAPGYGSATFTLDVLPAAYVIESLALTRSIFSTSTLPDDAFRTLIGVRSVDGTSLFRQGVSPVVAPLVLSYALSGDAIAQLKTSSGTGPTATVSVEALQDEAPSSVGTGGVAVDFDDPAQQGAFTVTVSGPGQDATYPGSAATVTVGVSSAQILVDTPAGTAVGSGLAERFQFKLNTVVGSPTVHFHSTDPTKALLASTTAGVTPAADYEYTPSSTAYYNVWVHTLAGATGQVEITMSAPGFPDASIVFDIVEGAIEIPVSTNSSTTALDQTWSRSEYQTGPTDDFVMYVGIAEGADPTDVTRYQPVSLATAGLPVTVDVTTTNGGLAGFFVAGVEATGLTIAPGANSSAATGTSLRFLSPLVDTVATVTPMADGMASRGVDVELAVGEAYFDVAEVNGTLDNSSDDRVGGGLKHEYAVYPRNAPNGHEPFTVRVASSDPAKMLVALGDDDVGAASIDIAYASNQTGSTSFWVHGLSGQAGAANLEVSCVSGTCLFDPLSYAVTVVAPVINVKSVATSTTTATLLEGTQEDFAVELLVKKVNGQYVAQRVSATTGGYPVTLTTSDAARFPLATQAAPTPAGSLVVTIPSGSTSTAATYASGGPTILFTDYLDAGSYPGSVTATGPGAAADALSTASFSRSSTQCYVSMVSNGVAIVGRGLEKVNPSVKLNCGSGSADANNHGGVTVHLAFDAGGRFLLASSGQAPAGSAALDVVFPAGSKSQTFCLQGEVGGALGSSTLTASVEHATAATQSWELKDWAISLSNADMSATMTGSLTAAASPDPFRPAIGIRSGASFYSQPVRVGVSYTVTVETSNPAYSQLREGASGPLGASVTVAVGAGATETVDLQHVRVANGSVTVTATGSNGADGDTHAVTVRD